MPTKLKTFMNFATSKTSPLIDGAEIFGSRIFKIVQILNSDKTYQHYLEQPRLVEKDLMVGYMSYIFFQRSFWELFTEHFGGKATDGSSIMSTI